MKRFHMHMAVENIDQNVKFYSTLFGAAPTVRKPDYAKWMLEDPRVNFAISARGAKPGLDHVGIQVDNETELADIHSQLARADQDMLAQEGTSCCYAKSNKYWVQDPQGIAWEAYQTLGEVPVFGDGAAATQSGAEVKAACCAPAAR
ncbi:MAG: ArsI/CadI family heavy metal resistance metalloenzyme [Pseudomonadota bacterium]